LLRSAQNKVFVIRDLVNLKYKDGEDASVHINEFQEFLNQLSLMNLELADEMQALILLSSLSDS
jgi:phage/plasmid-associated DNA primase